MLLSDGGINWAIVTNALSIEPYDRTRLQPSSYDVTLGDSFVMYVPKEYPDVLDPLNMGDAETTELQADWITLFPGEFALATTAETITLDSTLAARVEGKSTLGRCGLAVHVTAGFIDPGFTGQVTLELVNLNKVPIKLTAGMPIGQLCVFKLDAPARRPYGSQGLGSHYQGQKGATPPWNAQNPGA